MTDLLSCPFCGAKALLMHGGPGNSFVGCTECKATSDDCSEERAVDKWNRRTLSSQEEEIEGLRKALEAAREIVSAIVGENQPARSWACVVRGKIDAALEGSKR